MVSHAAVYVAEEMSGSRFLLLIVGMTVFLGGGWKANEEPQAGFDRSTTNTSVLCGHCEAARFDSTTRRCRWCVVPVCGR